MGVFNKLRGELVDIIEWVDDSHGRLAWRFPRYNNEIKNGAQLIVREGQQAVFVYRGKIGDVFGPGSYTLVTENLPIMSTLQGWKHGFNSPFRSEVYFINTRPITDLRWGTPQPVTLRDPDFGMVQARANGLCIVRVADPVIFLRQIIGTDSAVDVDEITEVLRRLISQSFADLVSDSGMGVLDLQGRGAQVGEKLRDLVQERTDDEYGLAINEILVNVSLPDEITQAMTRGVARGVEESGWMNQLKNMDTYQRAKSIDAMTEAAKNPAGGIAGGMMGAGLGWGMGQQMAQTAAPQQGAPTPPPIRDAQAFHVARDGQATGPFPAAEIGSMVDDGKVTADTLVWAAGMDEWTRAGDVPALAKMFTTHTPPPVPES